MFEVGKVYKGKYHSLIVKCVWTNGVYATLEYETSKECFCSDHREGWKEYTPPVIHTRYVHWYKSTTFSNDIWTTTDRNEKSVSYPHSEWIKTEKITCEEK